MTTETRRVVVLGDIAMDWVITVDALPTRDGLALAQSHHKFQGGSAANVAVGLARLGQRVSFIGQIGDDEDGRFLLASLEEEGIDTGAVTMLEGYETPTCVVLVEDGGDHVIIVLPRDSDVHRLEAPDLTRIADAQAVHIGPSHTGVAKRAAMRARESDVLVFYAPGGLVQAVSRAELWPILGMMDGLLVSRDEASALTDRATPEEAAKGLLDTGPRVVVVTTGATGALVATDAGVSRVPAFPVDDIRDTTGAGDAFAAGFIAGRLRGLDWETAAYIGNAVAAETIRHLGARIGFPNWEEALAAAAPGLNSG